MIIIGSINEYCGNVKSPEFGGINELMTDGWILWIEMIISDMINEFYHVKLIDFGLSVLLKDKNCKAYADTLQGYTPNYVAPEII